MSDRAAAIEATARALLAAWDDPGARSEAAVALDAAIAAKPEGAVGERPVTSSPVSADERAGIRTGGWYVVACNGRRMGGTDLARRLLDSLEAAERDLLDVRDAISAESDSPARSAEIAGAPTGEPGDGR